VQESDAGSYDVVLTNPVGTLTSKAATLAISTPLAVVSAPSAVTVTVGTPATMSIVASGSGPFTYQWYKDGVAITGTGATQSFPLSAATAGSYTVKITNPAGSATSAPAKIVLISPPSNVRIDAALVVPVTSSTPKTP
jgi:hypothetical protein